MSSIKKNLVYNILLSVSNLLFPLVTFPYAARILGPEGIGVVNFAQNFCQYFILIAALGIPTYGNREIAKVRDDIGARSKIFVEICIIKVISTFGVLIPYFIIIFSVTKFSDYSILYYWGAFYILVNLTTIEWFFSGLENFRYITIRSILVKGASVIFMFLFVKNVNDITPYFLIIILSTLVNGLFNIYYAAKFVRFNFKWSQLQLKKHIAPLTLLFSYFLAISMYSMLDTILLGLLSTNMAVGFYTSANRLIKICLMMITSLGDVLVPRLTKEVANKNYSEIRRLINKSSNFVFTFGIPMAAGIFILAPELIVIFSGKEFLPAVNTIRILSMLIPIIGLANIFAGQILIPLAKDKLLLIGSIIGGVISFLFNIVLIPLLKENGAAISIVFAETSVMLFALFFAKKLLSFPLSLQTFFKNLFTIAPYFFIATLSRYFLNSPVLIVLITVLAALPTFIIAQVYFINNSLIKENINFYRTKVKYLLLSKLTR